MGYVCVLRKNKEFYYPAIEKEFRKKMIPLVKQVWLAKMAMEYELQAIVISELGENKLYLPPNFQRSK